MTTPETTPGNAPEWTVSELAGALKRTLEDRFGHLRVKGELGKVSYHSSGHVYLDIKDDRACIAGVLWRGSAAKLKMKLQQGLEVVATGRITTFPGKSQYQIVIDTIEPAGVGALMALLDARRRALEAEGLFAASRKRPLPFLPTVIGVVTSPTGAVIRDILHRLSDRFPRHVLVWPVRVQGETCGQEVAAAIAGLNGLPAGGRVPRPDVIIVARGGGSLEDLWGFNDEAVVRAAAASAIPLVSAVGHETDWTLLDGAADLRAPTPTGAAEMVVPVRAELLSRLDTLALRRRDGQRRALDAHRTALRSAARALPGPEALLMPARQRLDMAAARLGPALLANARAHEGRLRGAADHLARHTPRLEVARARGRVEVLGARLRGRFAALVAAERQRIGHAGERLSGLVGRRDRAVAGIVERGGRRVAGLGQVLGTLGYRSVLERGFALVRDEGGGPVRRAADVASGARLELQFADGSRIVRDGEGRPDRTPPRRSRPAGAAELAQESLFDP